jgi:phage FluMu gp28-like protein
MKIEGFRPHKGQQRVIDKIINGPEKYITVVSPRQQGKSLLLINLILYYGINDKGCKIGIIAPIYQQARKLMEDLYEAIKDSGIVESTNFSNHEIKLRTGSKIYFRSSEREDGLRGYTFSYLFLDESSYQSESAWKRAIQPTALVHGKKVVLFSTPRGRDYFYQMYMLGEDPAYPNYASVRMEQGDNPYINQEEVAAAKKVLPEAIYRAEYQGEFLEGESMVFQNFKTNAFSKYPQRQGKVYIGVDLGRESDYTVAVAMDETGNVIEIYRDNQKDWDLMQNNIITLARKYSASIMIETNSMGTVIFESIKKQYQDTHPFNTSMKSKNEIVESLILAFNDNQIAIPDEDLLPEMHQELEVFEMSYNPKTRNVKYGARSPFHDDLVIALCIANWNRLQNKSYGQYAVMGRYR